MEVFTYAGYSIDCTPVMTEDGQFQPQVAVAFSNGRTLFKELFQSAMIVDDYIEAVELAMERAMNWIDDRCENRHRVSFGPTGVSIQLIH